MSTDPDRSVLRVARSSAVKARSQATNQIKALIVTGPAQLREQLRHLPTGIIAACARLRPGHNLGDAEQATKTALRRLARRHQRLSEEIAEADHELDQLVHQVAPALLALPGVGPEVAGQVLTSGGDNLNRIKSEAAFAHLYTTPYRPHSRRTGPSNPLPDHRSIDPLAAHHACGEWDGIMAGIMNNRQW